MKDAIADRKKKTKKLSLLNTPLRSINAYLANKRADKKETEDINKMIMKVDNLKLDGETRERKAYVNRLILNAKRKMAFEKREEARNRKKLKTLADNTQMSLYKNINARKKSGTSRTKAKSTVSDKAYSNMKKGFPKKKPK